MKPITGVPAGILTSVAIIVGLAFVGSRIPDSIAAGADEEASQAAEEAVAPAVEGLEIIITGIRNDKGKVIVAVFDEAQPFEYYDYDRAIEYGEFPAELAVQGMARLPFPDLESGPYAVSLFHDENDNDDFDWSGDWPEEGYGTSGADDAYDEPTFEAAAVPGGRVIIPMFYLD